KSSDFDRNLQSLIHLPDFSEVKGIVIGRFQKESEITNGLLTQIIKTKRELNNIPVLANIDFGHTSPIISFPVGGTCKVEATSESQSLRIIEH
ncbi:LD-carboxypeptidase, partial [Candidatus Woesebacteria bacterium CG_4_9_14_3_um_filter_39_10]